MCRADCFAMLWRLRRTSYLHDQISLLVNLEIKLNKVIFLEATQEQNLQLINEYHSGTLELDHLPMTQIALQRMLLVWDSKLLLAWTNL